jgi:Zn-dependent membrane protease YugP
VAAHEAGHAIQHKVGYSMLQARMALVPVTNIASQILPISLFAGIFFLPFQQVFMVVALCYAVLTLFQLITLPVEFDASARAKQELVGLGIIGEDELVGVRKTLDAAAWTYVAAFISSLAWMVYYFLAARR